MKTTSISRNDNFIWLLLALVLVMFNDALMEQLDLVVAERANNVLFLVIIFVAVLTIEENQGKWLYGKLAATLLISVLMLSKGLISSDLMSKLQLFAYAGFLGLTVLIAWRQVMFAGTVDRNKIVGAICIYILIGVIWSLAYLLTEEFFPGSFNGLKHDTWQENMDAMTYYSMVTLTTLGYGDITPAAPLARFLAYLEAITGIFYTTVLVASLVGVQLNYTRESTGSGSTRIE